MFTVTETLRQCLKTSQECKVCSNFHVHAILCEHTINTACLRNICNTQFENYMQAVYTLLTLLKHVNNTPVFNSRDTDMFVYSSPLICLSSL